MRGLGDYELPEGPNIANYPSQLSPDTRSILSKLMFGELNNLPTYNAQVIRETLNNNSGIIVAIIALIAYGVSKR